jgi:hypothetical protein
MINGEKYVNGSWTTTEIPTRKLHNKTDIITSLPVDIYTDGQSASADIKGNMSQSGTPAPTTPITPSECGDLVSNNYVIPIITGSTTTPVYLGQVQSTRKIKKLVLTGGENVELQSTNTHGIANFWFYGLLVGIEKDNQTVALSSHFVQTYTPIADVTSPCFSVSTTSESLYLKVNASDISTATDMNTYLAQQYANGTPVCVWYVLAYSTTTTLNEPLRKIGDYSDSVSVTGISTTAGGIEFDVDTTLKPSEVDLTYHGWHDISPKQRENGEWV